MLELDELLSGVSSQIIVNEEYLFGRDYIENTQILELSNVSINGRIYKDSSDEIIINATINGEMTLEDSITLEPIKYPFSMGLDEKIEENFINHENTLDIMELLWQNIVLEVPLRYTLVSDTSDINGNGWKLVSEEDNVKNNPFSVLLENEEKE